MAPPRKTRIQATCPMCHASYEREAWAEASGKQTTCSRPCSYRLRMQTRRSPQDKLRKSPEHQIERRRRKDATYRTRHRAELNRKQAAYIKSHPDVAYMNQQRRRARWVDAPIRDLTRQQWRAIKDAYGFCCAYCGLTFERLTMDHIIPLCKGGGHTAANVVPACKPCNSKKATRIVPPPLLPKYPLDFLKV